MTQQEIADTTMQLKRELHSMMNGATSSSMRASGVSYGVNFGVEGTRLSGLASQLPHDAALARALWSESVRECRLLATMTYPPSEFAPDVCEAWIDTLRTAEEAQYLSFHLLSRLPYAQTKAMEWTAAEGEMRQLCGLLTAGRLIAGGTRYYGRERNELLDQLETAIYSPSLPIAKAAINALQHFAGQNSFQEKEVDRIFASYAKRKQG